MSRNTLRADLLMLVTAMIWGTVFIAQRYGMEHIGPFLFSGTRFLLAAFVLLPLFFWRPFTGAFKAPMSRGLFAGGAAMGLALAIGINLQQVGLLFTSVTNAGFITGLYVIMVPIIGLFFGQRTGFGTWLGALTAVVGMALLSIGPDFAISKGDWLQLTGAVVWGAHVLLVGFFASRYDPLRLAIIQFAVCGLISMVLALSLESIALEPLTQALPAIAYGALLGVGVGFTLQVIAQRDAIASHAAVIFSLEAVFAAIAGAIFLGESLSAKGYIGCALMLAGMLIAQLWPQKKLNA